MLMITFDCAPNIVRHEKEPAQQLLVSKGRDITVQ